MSRTIEQLTQDVIDARSQRDAYKQEAKQARAAVRAMENQLRAVRAALGTASRAAAKAIP